MNFLGHGRIDPDLLVEVAATLSIAAILSLLVIGEREELGNEQ